MLGLSCALPASLRASSPIWASEASLARTLAQIGELARRLIADQPLNEMGAVYALVVQILDGAIHPGKNLSKG